jgi:hypothetical protein
MARGHSDTGVYYFSHGHVPAGYMAQPYGRVQLWTGLVTLLILSGPSPMLGFCPMLPMDSRPRAGCFDIAQLGIVELRERQHAEPPVHSWHSAISAAIYEIK